MNALANWGTSVTFHYNLYNEMYSDLASEAGALIIGGYSSTPREKWFPTASLGL